MSGVALTGVCMMMVQPRITVATYSYRIVELLARQRGRVLGAISAKNLAAASVYNAKRITQLNKKPKKRRL